MACVRNHIRVLLGRACACILLTTSGGSALGEPADEIPPCEPFGLALRADEASPPVRPIDTDVSREVSVLRQLSALSVSDACLSPTDSAHALRVHVTSSSADMQPLLSGRHVALAAPLTARPLVVGYRNVVAPLGVRPLTVSCMNVVSSLVAGPIVLTVGHGVTPLTVHPLVVTGSARVPAPLMPHAPPTHTLTVVRHNEGPVPRSSELSLRTPPVLARKLITLRSNAREWAHLPAPCTTLQLRRHEPTSFSPSTVSVVARTVRPEPLLPGPRRVAFRPPPGPPLADLERRIVADTIEEARQRGTAGLGPQLRRDLAAILARGTSTDVAYQAFVALLADFAGATDAEKSTAMATWDRQEQGGRSATAIAYFTAFHFYKTFQYDTAIANIDCGLKTGGGRRDRLLMLRALCVWGEGGHGPETLAAVDAFLREEPKSDLVPQARFLAAWVHLYDGHVETARPLLRKLVTDYPGSDFATRARQVLDGLPQEGK